MEKTYGWFNIWNCFSYYNLGRIPWKGDRRRDRRLSGRSSSEVSGYPGISGQKKARTEPLYHAAKRTGSGRNPVRCFEGRTTGTPISLIVFNKDQHSRDYSEIASYYRPGHADYTFDVKYGFRDYRGGGRSSGRETIGRVAGGAVAARLLSSLGISFCTYTRSIGPVEIQNFSREEIFSNKLYMPDREAAQKASEYLENCIASRNSAGGIIECVIHGVPAGLGEPVFDKLDASLAKAVMSIGAVKGVEIGDGFAVSSSTGREDNDGFRMRPDGHVEKTSNHAGGILGGISDGSDIILRAAVKPTPSIASDQKTVNKSGQEITVSIKGRHDPVIVPRAVVVVEAMAALTLADALLLGTTSRLEYLQKIWKEN